MRAMSMDKERWTRAQDEDDEDDEEDEQIAGPDRYSALFIPAYVRLRSPIASRVD